MPSASSPRPDGARGCRDSVALATSACHTIMLAGMLFHTRLACVRLCHVTTAVCQTIMVAGMLAHNRLAYVRLCHMTTSVCQTVAFPASGGAQGRGPFSVPIPAPGFRTLLVAYSQQLHVSVIAKCHGAFNFYTFHTDNRTWATW